MDKICDGQTDKVTVGQTDRETDIYERIKKWRGRGVGVESHNNI